MGSPAPNLEDILNTPSNPLNLLVYASQKVI